MKNKELADDIWAKLRNLKQQIVEAPDVYFMQIAVEDLGAYVVGNASDFINSYDSVVCKNNTLESKNKHLSEENEILKSRLSAMENESHFDMINKFQDLFDKNCKEELEKLLNSNEKQKKKIKKFEKKFKKLKQNWLSDYKTVIKFSQDLSELKEIEKNHTKNCAMLQVFEGFGCSCPCPGDDD